MAPPFASDDAVDRVFHALSDATRRRMLEHLSARPASPSEMAAPLGISLAAVVQHMQLLEKAGLIRTEKIGRVRTCSLEGKGLSLASRWIEDRKSLWNQRFDRLGDILDEDEDD